MNEKILLLKKRGVIDKEIKNNFINDIGLINTIEKYLVKKRGYVFKMPKPYEPIIALMSGGLDTTVVISILLEKYKLNVYPLFIRRDAINQKYVNEAVSFFSDYFKNKYPKLFHDPFEMNLSIPPKEIKRILELRENDIIKDPIRKGIPLQPSFYAQYAMYYSKYLEDTINVKARTIIGAWLPSNSEWYGYESFTSLRSVMFSLCCADNDFSWQFTSLPMERELNFYFEKDTLIKYGNFLKIPLEKTRSCCNPFRFHCGTCPPCGVRQDGFSRSGVTDLTTYRNKILTPIQKIRRSGKKILRFLIK